MPRTAGKVKGCGMYGISMEQAYKILYKGGEGEIIEKKSRFIATVIPIHSEQEAQEELSRLRKKYWDATHNCFAYVIGEKQEKQRCSDDGEPSGTAGRPMLDVLLGEGIHNILVVVTRYFGGTLLGTGGLVRAYQKAVQEGLSISQVVEKCPGKQYQIETDYSGIGKLQYIIGQMGLHEMETEYTDNVTVFVMVPLEQCGAFEKKVTEATAGQAGITILSETQYGIIDGEVKLL